MEQIHLPLSLSPAVPLCFCFAPIHSSSLPIILSSLCIFLRKAKGRTGNILEREFYPYSRVAPKLQIPCLMPLIRRMKRVGGAGCERPLTGCSFFSPKINKTRTEQDGDAQHHCRIKDSQPFTPQSIRARVHVFVSTGSPSLCTSANKSDRRENLMNCLIYKKPSAHQWFMGLITESIHEPRSPVVLPFAAGWQKYCSQTNPPAPSHQKAINPKKLPRVSCILALNV